MSKDKLLKLIKEKSDEYKFDSFYNINFLKKRVDDFIIETQYENLEREKMKSFLIEISALSLSYISTVDEVE